MVLWLVVYFSRDRYWLSYTKNNISKGDFDTYFVGIVGSEM